MEAFFFIDQDMVSCEGLTLFADFLVKTRPDYIQKPIKLRASFHFLDEVRDLLNREIDGSGEVLFKLIIKRAMLQIDLTFLIATTAVKAEVKGQELR
jgi:hypothetical protein